MNESAIEQRLVDGVKKMGGMCMKFTSPGHAGVPDRIILTADGKILFAELKTEKGRLTRLQAYTIDEMKKRGADVRVVKGLSEVKALLEELTDESQNLNTNAQIKEALPQIIAQLNEMRKNGTNMQISRRLFEVIARLEELSNGI
ncbi:MAG: VRR-NUC domain-containing protein [Oscillospiraceae bacterium]|nr:VRR-NUC domain-containing protein [Oscillospiraceae bacterium]